MNQNRKDNENAKKRRVIYFSTWVKFSAILGHT
jgi:hypothetical protein